MTTRAALAVLTALLAASCTSSGSTATPAPASSAGPGGAVIDVCAELLPPRALAILEQAGVRSNGTPKAVLVPLTAPGKTAKHPTQGCEVRLDTAPLEGVVVRRTQEGAAVRELQASLRRNTGEVPGFEGYDVRYSDAASSMFAFRRGGTPQAVIVQVVVQRPGVDRVSLALDLLLAVLFPTPAG